jgi:hypothetical protein
VPPEVLPDVPPLYVHAPMPACGGFVSGTQSVYESQRSRASVQRLSEPFGQLF